MMAHFYILYSASTDRFYVGHTGGPVAERLRRHLSNHRGFTSKAKDWAVVHEECFATKAAAHAREKEVKAWKSKTKIKALITGSEHSA